MQETKAARYLKQMRPRGAPLPGAPQIAPKKIVLPGDYARPKKTVGKSKLGPGKCPKMPSLRPNPKKRREVERRQKLALGPKGREKTWRDFTTMPFRIRVMKKAAYGSMPGLPWGNPYLHAFYSDEE